ncbi:hypothetical protein HN51_040115, partial [Arachis hypogaea]
MCLAPLVIPSATNLVVSGNQLRVAATATCHLRRSIEDASTPPSVALPSFTPWWKCPCIADALASAATVRPEQPLTAMLPSSLPRRLPQGVPPPLPSPRSQISSKQTKSSNGTVGLPISLQMIGGASGE